MPKSLAWASVLASLVFPHPSPAADIDEEFKDLIVATAGHIHRYYIEEVSPDTLVRAGVRGMFAALDVDSNYTLHGIDHGWKENLTTFLQVARAVDSKAYYPVSADTLVRFAIAGMLDELDPYTVFMERRNLANFNIHTKGHYGGLGFRIQTVYPDSAIAVWSLLHDQTPAARAGIRSGDLILAIDDSTTRYMSVGDAADLMRGEPGTAVVLTLARAGSADTVRKSIVRERVQVNSIAYHTLFPDSTGYLKLSGFQLRKSSTEVRQALVDLNARGLKRLIFDLRGNSGGYLHEAVKIADLLLPKDRLVVYTAGRAFPDTSWYRTEQGALLDEEAPLIIIVDQGSASASEIVAGAVQDWDRGLIMGMPTVGKGSVQQTWPIGDKAELKLTMAAYYTPSGRSIDKRMRKDSSLVEGAAGEYRTLTLGRIVRGGGGISPDIHLEGRKSTRLYNQLRGGRSLNSQFFHYARQQPHLIPDLSADFRVDDAHLRNFRKRASARGFEYVSEAEDYLNGLEKIAEKDDYSKLEKTVNRLRREIDKIEEQHWEDSEELIKWKLTFDILEKAKGMTAAHQFDVSVDPVVLRAREILSDSNAYEELYKHPEIGLASGGADEDLP